MDKQGGVGEIAALFLKLGGIGFGGPAAHIAMMEDEVVQKRNWMSREQFLDLVGVTSMIPGPNSTEMAIHVGYLRGGFLGLVVAGLCFILPAVVLTTAFAWLYMSFGAVPQVAWMLYGVKPAVLAVILGALWRLGNKALKGWRLTFLGVAVMLVALTEFSGVLALLGAGWWVCFGCVCHKANQILDKCWLLCPLWVRLRQHLWVWLLAVGLRCWHWVCSF